MTDETQPVRPEGAPVDQPAASAETPTTATTETPRRGLRERFRRLRTSSDGSRTFGLAALIASALAGVIVGGLGVTAVHAMTHDRDGRPDWSHRQGPMGRDLGGDRGDRAGDRRGPVFGGPGGLPGDVQPTTPPEDDDSSDSDSGGTSS